MQIFLEMSVDQNTHRFELRCYTCYLQCSEVFCSHYKDLVHPDLSHRAMTPFFVVKNEENNNMYAPATIQDYYHLMMLPTLIAPKVCNTTPRCPKTGDYAFKCFATCCCDGQNRVVYIECDFQLALIHCTIDSQLSHFDAIPYVGSPRSRSLLRLYDMTTHPWKYKPNQLTPQQNFNNMCVNDDLFSGCHLITQRIKSDFKFDGLESIIPPGVPFPMQFETMIKVARLTSINWIRKLGGKINDFGMQVQPAPELTQTLQPQLLLQRRQSYSQSSVASESANMMVYCRRLRELESQLRANLNLSSNQLLDANQKLMLKAALKQEGIWIAPEMIKKLYDQAMKCVKGPQAAKHAVGSQSHSAQSPVLQVQQVPQQQLREHTSFTWTIEKRKSHFRQLVKYYKLENMILPATPLARQQIDSLSVQLRNDEANDVENKKLALHVARIQVQRSVLSSPDPDASFIIPAQQSVMGENSFQRPTQPIMQEPEPQFDRE